jgi:hypothetical protein
MMSSTALEVALKEREETAKKRAYYAATYGGPILKGAQFTWPKPKGGERCNCNTTDSNKCENCAGRGVLPIPLGCLFDKKRVYEQLDEQLPGAYVVSFDSAWQNNHVVYNISPTAYPILTQHKITKEALDGV